MLHSPDHRIGNLQVLPAWPHVQDDSRLKTVVQQTVELRYPGIASSPYNPLQQETFKESNMRGAGMRLKHDVRRLWRCPVCNVELKAGAEVTSQLCSCPGRPAMKLQETLRGSRELKEPTSPYLEFEFEPGELAAPGSFCRPVEVESLPPESIGERTAEFGEGITAPEPATPSPGSKPADRRSGSNQRRERGTGQSGPRPDGRRPDRPRREGPSTGSQPPAERPPAPNQPPHGETRQSV
ncbi:MAG: hypothetical protein DWH91_01815, partial [Planctomycetota bacterium]